MYHQKTVYSRLGYNTKKRVLKNPKGEITLNVILQNSGYELGEVTVTEAKRQTGMTERIKGKDAKPIPDASGGNIESLIATQAGGNSQNQLMRI